jgi:solute carrier family 45 protein 1/2/4
MMSTFIPNSVESGWVLVALAGIPWAVGTWILFTLISQDIFRLRGEAVLGIVDQDDCQNVAATVMVLHNAAISAPQIVAALGSSLVFLLAGSSKADVVVEHGNGLEVWLLRAGGLSALAAAWLMRKLPT